MYAYWMCFGDPCGGLGTFILQWLFLKFTLISRLSQLPLAVYYPCLRPLLNEGKSKLPVQLFPSYIYLKHNDCMSIVLWGHFCTYIFCAEKRRTWVTLPVSWPRYPRWIKTLLHLKLTLLFYVIVCSYSIKQLRLLENSIAHFHVPFYSPSP